MSLILYFGFIFFRLSYNFLETKPSFFFGEACICVNLLEDGILLLCCFVIVAKKHQSNCFHLFRKLGFQEDL